MMGNGIGRYIIMGILVFIVVNFVVDQVRRLIQILWHRRRRIETAIPILPNWQENIQRNWQENIQGNRREHPRTTFHRVGPPPELPRRSGVRRMEPDSFPRCPIHRCSNRPGEFQKIFWDVERNMWRCYKNHYFLS